MKIFNVFILMFVFPCILIASECGGLKEGEVVRLNSPEKSLEKFKTQDQDGLGICYANSTSLVLQSVLENHPVLSYIHLASIYKQSQFDVKRKQLEVGSTDNNEIYAKIVKNKNSVLSPNPEEDNQPEKWKVGLDGGNVCGIIDAVKKMQKDSPNGGICLSESLNIESALNGQDDDFKQYRSILALSKYMNKFQDQFGEAKNIKKNSSLFEKLSSFDQENYFHNLVKLNYTPEEIKKNQEIIQNYNNFKLALSNILKNEENKNFKECKKLSIDSLNPLINNLIPLLISQADCFSLNQITTEDPFCKLNQALMSTNIRFDGAINISLKKELIQNIFDSFSSDKSLAVGSNLRKKFYNILFKKSDIKMRSEKFNIDLNTMINEISPKVFDNIAKEINQIKTTGNSKTCQERKLMDYLTSEEFIEDTHRNRALCKTTEIIEDVQDVVSSTAATGLSDISKVKKFILKNANLDFDEALLGLFGNDCLDGNKIRIPENLNCFDTKVSEKKKDAIMKIILSELNNNHAVAGTVVGAIFNKRKINFSDDEKTALHSVGITGAKCMAGKLKFLIQNSWGDYKSKNRDIVNDSQQSGASWVSSKLFFENFSKISTIGIK